MVRQKPRLTLVVDPRFSGGTSAAVAREIFALADLCALQVVAISSKLFKGTTVHPLLEEACAETGTPLVWDPAMINADLVALHNPSFLKFDTAFKPRIFCDRLFVVCHENFIRPDGPESFDVGHCLALIAERTVARRKYLAPVSGWNRQCAKIWMQDNPTSWQLAPLDWTNICDFELVTPTSRPRDRRGRHSRPGLEKFAPMAQLLQTFPPECEAVRMMGADSLLDGDYPSHWDLLPFGAEPVAEFLQSIDFFVYYTHPFLQESFGRVIAEALAAGKVVITCPQTAATFSDAVIAAAPAQVNTIVASLLTNPKAYNAQVARGHAGLARFGTGAFQDRFARLLDATSPIRSTTSLLETAYDFL